MTNNQDKATPIKVYWTSWGKLRTVSMRSWTVPFVSHADHLAELAKLKAENAKLRLQRDASVRSDYDQANLRGIDANQRIAELDLEVQAAGQGVK